jgi:hypothetical protein
MPVTTTNLILLLMSSFLMKLLANNSNKVEVNKNDEDGNIKTSGKNSIREW